jgi:hypothetical protein
MPPPTTARFVGGGIAPTGLARTVGGDWVVAWDDARDDTYVGLMRDAYVRISTNDGVSWGDELRVDQTPAGSAQTTLSSVASTGEDGFVVAYVDSREDDIDDDVWLNRTTTTTPDFSANELRVESDERDRNPPTDNTANVATDSAGRVYGVFASHSPGRYADVFVRRSDDGGYAFGDTVRVSTSAPGTLAAFNPQIEALADGHVFVAFKETDASGATRILFNRSTDFGATWLPADEVLGAVTLNGSLGTGSPHPEFQLTAEDGGRVFVLWSDGTDLWLARSDDFGATFSTADVDGDSRTNRRNGQGSLCVAGDQVVMVFMSHAPLPGFTVPSIWGRVSQDGGATWDPRVHFRPGSSRQLYWAMLPEVACGENGEAVAVFTDINGGGRYRTHTNRWNGSSWDGDQQLVTSLGQDEAFHRLVHAGGSTYLTAFTNFSGVHTSRSTDGGVTWSATTRHDADLTAPAFSLDPYVATDGLGRIWMTWGESTQGYREMAARLSSDSGATWSETHRVSRHDAQGAFRNLRNRYGGRDYVVADEGVAYFSWAAERTSSNYDAPFNAWDVDDFDRDRTATAADCDDGHPGVWAAPVEVAVVTLEKPAAGVVRIGWASQDGSAGPATAYDLVRGSLGDLRSTGTFGSAACLASGTADGPYDDDGPAPSPGTGEYVLVRAVNPCGTGSYGDATATPDPRDDLDVSGPCP